MHATPSLHPLEFSQQLATGTEVHAPALHVSEVQASPSLQSASLAQHPGAHSCVQKPLGPPRQASAVHELPSLHSPVDEQQPPGPIEHVPPGPEH